ncbi:MAG: AcrR family transcriptional regulator [Polyangiales bacterium]|jgi:AcrR family transcriptional regulator
MRVWLRLTAFSRYGRALPEPDTQDRILHVADQIVRQEGWPALSIRRVARDAGVSVGTVQYYFASSAELLEAVTEPWHRGVREAFSGCVAELAEGADAVERLIDLSLEVYELARLHRPLLAARRTDTNERGHVAPRHAGSLDRWLERGSQFASERLGGTPFEWRLNLQGVEFLVLGFASTHAEEFQREEHIGAIKSFLRMTFREMAARYKD